MNASGVAQTEKLIYDFFVGGIHEVADNLIGLGGRARLIQQVAGRYERTYGATEESALSQVYWFGTLTI
jgi:hypothetical protein